MRSQGRQGCGGLFEGKGHVHVYMHTVRTYIRTYVIYMCTVCVLVGWNLVSGVQYIHIPLCYDTYVLYLPTVHM